MGSSVKPSSSKDISVYNDLRIRHFCIDGFHIDGGKKGIPAELLFHMLKNVNDSSALRLLHMQMSDQNACLEKVRAIGEDIHTQNSISIYEPPIGYQSQSNNDDVSPILPQDLNQYSTDISLSHDIRRAQITQNQDYIALFLQNKDKCSFVQSSSDVLGGGQQDSTNILRSRQRMEKGLKQSLSEELDKFQCIAVYYGLGEVTCSRLSYTYELQSDIARSLSKRCNFFMPAIITAAELGLSNTDTSRSSTAQFLSLGTTTAPPKPIRILSNTDFRKTTLAINTTFRGIPKQELQRTPTNILSESPPRATFYIGDSEEEDEDIVSLEDSVDSAVSSDEETPYSFSPALSNLSGSSYIKVYNALVPITQLPVDAIVNDTNAHLSVRKGSCKYIFSAGGRKLKDKCKELPKTNNIRYGKVTCVPGKAVLTSSGDLRKKAGHPQVIIHAATLDIQSSTLRNTHTPSDVRNILIRSYSSVVDTVISYNLSVNSPEDRIHTLGIPLLGTERSGYTVKESCDCFLNAMAERYPQLKRQSIMVVLHCHTEYEIEYSQLCISEAIYKRRLRDTF